MAEKQEYFVLTLPLKLQPWQEHKLNRGMEVNRQIYNAMLKKAFTRYRQMCQTKAYRDLQSQLNDLTDPKARKEVYRKLDGLKAVYRLRRYDLTKDSTPYRQCFGENTDSPVVQNLAIHVWKALDMVSSGRGNTVHFKKPGELNSLEGKNNHTSIRYRDGCMIWKKLKLPIVFQNNGYEEAALGGEIRYCRLKRRIIRGRYRYYADLILKGKCPVRKTIPLTRECTAGLYLGIQKIALVCPEGIYAARLPGKDPDAEERRREIARKMERSRRMMNPHHFDEKGRLMPGHGKWQYSGNYRRLRREYRELERKQIAGRQEKQRKLAEEILGMGKMFCTERLDYARLKQKPKDVSFFGSGRIRKKVCFGREIENRAPVHFLKLLERKLSQHGRLVFSFPPLLAAAGSLNHVSGKTESLAYYTGIRSIDGSEIDKSVYSAFLLQHMNPHTGKVNLEECRNAFPDFLAQYQRYLKDLSISKTG